MKKNISRNPLWPDWYNGKKIDETKLPMKSDFHIRW